MRQTQTRWYLLIVVTLAYIAFGLVTAVIGVIIDKFQVQYNVSLRVAAMLPFAFYLAYGLFSIPFGLAMDRFGARLVILLGMGLMTVGCFLFYLSNNYLLVIFMIFMIGVGVTAIQTAGNPFIRVLDTPERYTANLTIIIGIGALGYAFSPLMVPFIQAKGFSWETVYLIFGILNAILFLLLLKAKFPKVVISEEEKIRLSVIHTLLKNPIILTYTIGIFLYVGAEVGTSSYILIFMQKVHGLGVQQSLWAKGTLLYAAFPSISALVVALFWLLQAFGRLIIGPMMNRIRPKSIFIFHSAGTCIALLIAIFGSKILSLISFALVGYFTCAAFTSIFSATIQSFDKNHGTISGILCTAIVGGAVIGWLVGVMGNLWNMQVAMGMNFLAFSYIFALAVWGRGKL